DKRASHFVRSRYRRQGRAARGRRQLRHLPHPGRGKALRRRLCLTEHRMKLGIIGAGNVGCACALSAATRGSAREIVLVNRTRKTAEAVATDIRYGTLLGPKVEIVDGDYDALNGAGL